MSIGGGSSSAEARTDRFPAIATSSAHARGRPQARGKFVFAGDEKVYVRGVVYGAFRPDANGREYQDVAAIERDFALMHANGLNALRIPHTMPPRSVLDAARRHGLWVMAGLSAEQYI
ncbi:MAG: glycosyl transferase, partial [Chloroflexi bacterium]